ncbi:nucleotide-binding alpha-beta plait domain-containing protein [Tanacetum coccineum]
MPTESTGAVGIYWCPAASGEAIQKTKVVPEFIKRKKSNDQSKEDDVAKISTSIFVSNFPDSVSAKDLFHSCKQYGHVVDSFIPMKRLKDGKRFGFVRFINVFMKNGNKYKTANQKKHEGRKNTFYDPSKEAGTFDSRNSFVNVLKGTNMVKETDSSPVIVLEEDCLNSKDLSNSLIGRVKDVGSLSNLKKVLCNEGVGSWFLVLRQASHDVSLLRVELLGGVEGIPFYKFCAWIRAKELRWIPEFSEDEEDDDHSEQEFISSEQLDLGLHIDGEDNGASEVPETIFENSDGMNGANPSLKYPPGFTPSVEKNGSMSWVDQGPVLSDSIGNSGGILCIWDPNSFRKDSVTVSDYFVIVRGVWIKSGIDILIVVVLKRFLERCSGDVSNDMRNLYGWRDYNNRLEILGKLQQVNKAQASEVAQKAKIKWYVEGDENTKFFHGMLNKKRSQLNIRGIMINGTWTDIPDAVKTGNSF